MTVHNTTKLNNRRAKICALESAGLAGVFASGIRGSLAFHQRLSSDCTRNAPLQSAEAAVPAVVFFQGLKELRLAKIRPERRRDDQFGVRNLPQKKITDAH